MSRKKCDNVLSKEMKTVDLQVVDLLKTEIYYRIEEFLIPFHYFFLLIFFCRMLQYSTRINFVLKTIFIRRDCFVNGK